ncbi:MAG TPA: protein kinase [Polyangiaceae bacterium]|nr:protein kinase [Polyangiaceae bacterium]
MAQASVIAGSMLGPYVLGDRLGLGGMAEVYVAQRAGPRGFAKRFAVKRILPELAQDARFVAMFCDEARICAGLCHPNIVQVVDFGEANGELFMAMEFVDGVSLARLLRTVSARRERFPHAVALHIAHEVLRGLAFAHEARDEQGRPLGIVHRDVSPGNVLIGRAGDVKLGDFGIVRSEFVDRRTYPGELKGKVGYMSPEQVMGSDVDPRSDLFTVGIILTEMLLARPLFTGQNEFEILTNIYEANMSVLDAHASELTPLVEATLRKALSREPAARFQNAVEFANALREVAREMGLHLGDSELVPWLSSLGILPSRSGTHERLVPAQPEAPLEVTARLSPDAVPAGSPAQTGQRTSQQSPAAPRAPRFGEPLTRLASWRSALDRMTLPAVLHAVAARAETGVLVARNQQREKHFYFVEGELRAARSTEHSELLGTRLLRAGRITERDLTDALNTCKQTQRSLGEELVARGIVRSSSLLRELVEQVEARFIELFAWNDGTLWFVPGVRELHLEVKAPALMPALVTHAIREAYTEDEIALWFSRACKLPVHRGQARRIDPTKLGLSLAERRALERAAKATSIEGLVSELSAERIATPREALFGLFVGVSIGIVSVPGWR